MKTTPSAISQDSVDGRIASSIGRPWKALAKGPEAFDCWGFVRYALDLSDAPDAPFLDETTRSERVVQLSKRFERVGHRTPYSILLMGRRGLFSHVGVYHPSGYVYHCVEGRGVCGHRFGQLGILGYDTFQFYLWGDHDPALRQEESVRSP